MNNNLTAYKLYTLLAVVKLKNMTLIKTNLCLTVKCKCGNIVAATMMYGGDVIDEEFTTTIAETHNNGGKIEFVNTDETKVKLGGCSCS